MRAARARAFSWCCSLSWAVAGCGPSAVDDGDGTGSASEGSTSSLASTGASASSTSADATTLADTTDATTSADSTGTTEGTETGEAVCPIPEGVSVAFTVTPDETLSATCSVTDVIGVRGESTIVLDCDGQEVTLVMSSWDVPAPNVSVGGLVQLDHVVDEIFWINRWLALRSAGGESDWLLAGGVSSSVLDPPGTTLDAFFGGTEGALTVTEADGLCAPIDDSCGPLERVALDFTLELGSSVRVFDQGTGIIDVLAFGYAFGVEEAMRYQGEPICDDARPAWFDLTMVWFPSD